MSKKEALKKEYRKQRKRIQSYISRRWKLGFDSDFVLPSIPKKITAGSVRRLKKITAEKLKQHEKRWYDPDTGEIFEEPHPELAKRQKEYRKSKNVSRGTVTVPDQEISLADLPDFDNVGKNNFVEAVKAFPDELSEIILSEIDLLGNTNKDFDAMLSDFVEQEGYITERQEIDWDFLIKR